MQHKARPKSRLLNTKVDKRDVTYTSGLLGVLKRTTNDQHLMGPRRSERWLKINIFSKIVGDFSRKFFRNVFVNFDFYNINCNILILILKN
jgi:hypothetical protein